MLFVTLPTNIGQLVSHNAIIRTMFVSQYVIYSTLLTPGNDNCATLARVVEKMRFVEPHSHKHWEDSLVRNGLEPFLYTDLVCIRCKVTWAQDHSILRSSILAPLNHLDCLVDVLSRRAGDDGPILVASIIQSFPLTTNECMALFILNEDRFASAAQYYETFDTALHEEQRMPALRFNVDGRRSCIVV